MINFGPGDAGEFPGDGAPPLGDDLDDFAVRATATLVGTRPELPVAVAAIEAIAQQTSHGLANFGRRVAGPATPVIDQLGQIDCPTLVMIGENDKPYLRAADVLTAKIPGARKVVLEGASHIVNIEVAEAFDRAAVEFLQSLA